MLSQKRLSLLIAAGLVVSLSAFPVFADDAPAAGDPPPAKAAHKPRMSLAERLDKMLKLTDAQKPTVHPILNDAEAQFAVIRKNKALSKEEKKAQMVAAYETLLEKLNPMLDANQQATLAKYVEHIKNPPAPKPKPKPKPADEDEQPEQPAPGEDD